MGLARLEPAGLAAISVPAGPHLTVARPHRTLTGFHVVFAAQPSGTGAAYAGRVSTRDDRCPGVFRTHSAADGELARVRVPGGRIDPAALDALALAAQEHGDGHLELTGRGNLQVRGIAADETTAFADAVAAAGLSSDAGHDRVRNVVLSPFSGLCGGLADLRPAAAALSESLTEADWTTSLSGRFWFALDDGRGDMLARSADVTGVAVDPELSAVAVDGVPVGALVPHSELPRRMLEAARTFATTVAGFAEGAWRVRDLDRAARSRLFDVLEEATGVVLPPAAHSEPRVGWFEQPNGLVTLGAVVPFGRLTAEQARFAAAVGVPVIVTPEREILLGDLDEAVAETVVRVLAPLGFVFDAGSPWTSLTACTGSPGCAASLADVRGDLVAHVLSRDPDAGVPDREHWVGCARGCGSPAGDHTRVEATADGYRRTRR